jgi:hypothetical protein
MRALRTQATWSQVSATVPGAALKQSDQFPGELDTVLTRGRWTAPGGQPRCGLIATSPGDVVGSTARIWVSRSGSPTGAPRGRSELLGWTPVAEVGVALALAVRAEPPRLLAQGMASPGTALDRAALVAAAPAHITPRG